MSLLKKQNKQNQDLYLENIKNIAALSALFTTTLEAPYLVSRATENIYCESLGAKNLGRDDTAIDAILDNVGVGIKTFLHNNGNTLQKVAEFNRDSHLYRDLVPKEKVRRIAELRNERLQFAINNYGVTSLIYHCITRKKDGTVCFYETPMDFIDIKNIKNVVSKQNSIAFEDGLNEYSFNLTKSVLMKRFSLTDTKYLAGKVQVEIIDNPYELLSKLITTHSARIVQTKSNPFVVLPLYSFSNSKGKFVAEKSGLNQWNAGGRARNANEVYIPISSKIHQVFPGFFPSRDIKFELILPNGNKLSTKVCQDGNKALMSDPNKALGKWLLRDVLDIKELQILTYEKLETIGIDSVRVTKIDSFTYEIEFMELGSYDEFAIEHNI